MTPFEIIAQTTQAIAANPSDANAYKQRALTLCQMQQYEDAMADLNTLIDILHTEDAEVFQLRGTLRMNKGDKTGALDDMRKALDLNPELLQQLSGEFKTKEKGHC
jgi:tetratricopeptide (TPR) repeat protein